MNDDHMSRDELVSRYLDGEASAPEVERVESDYSLLVRVNEMRAAMAALTAPVQTPAAELDQIREAAVAASSTTTSIVDLDSARIRKRRYRSQVLTAAAALVLLAVGFTALRSIDNGNDSDTAAEVPIEATADSMESFSADSDSSTAQSAPADMLDEEASDGGALADEVLPLSVLPNLLPDFDTRAQLVSYVEGIYAVPESSDRADSSLDGDALFDAEFDEQVFASLCDEGAALVRGVQANGTIRVDESQGSVDGEPVRIYAALGVDGELVIVTHPVGECESSAIADQLEPSSP